MAFAGDWLDTLIGRLLKNDGTPSSSGINIRVALFPDASGKEWAGELIKALGNDKGIKTGLLRNRPILDPDPDESMPSSSPETLLLAAANEAQNWRHKESSDMVVWGKVSEDGAWYHIHLSTLPIDDEDRPGQIGPLATLPLATTMYEEFAALFKAICLTAINTADKNKIDILRVPTALALQQSAEAIGDLPKDLSVRERACIQMFYANTLCVFAQRQEVPDLFAKTVEIYRLALKGLSKTETPLEWSTTQKNLGSVLQQMGINKNNDVMLLEEAETAFRTALETVQKESSPYIWAVLNKRLAETLYRLDLKTGDTDGMKESLVYFQNALQFFNKKLTPNMWCDTVDGLARTAQVLGRELGNAELLEKAIEACNWVSDARSLRNDPLQWAAAKNNLGSALFLFGRQTRKSEHIDKALTCFESARDVYQELGHGKMVAITEKNIAHAQRIMPHHRKTRPTHNTESGEEAPWWLADENGAPSAPDIIDDQIDLESTP